MIEDKMRMEKDEEVQSKAQEFERKVEGIERQY